MSAVIDFEYDGLLLSDFGYMMCCFDSNKSGATTGAELSFNTVSTRGGAYQDLTSTVYGEALSTTFEICKKCDENDTLTLEEFDELARWLNRKTWHKFKVINDECIDIYWESSFNVKKIEYGDRIVGAELELITNRPFALREPIELEYTIAAANTSFVINDTSSEEGFIYPKMEIEVNASGDLSIYNSLDDRTMNIANCVSGEVITLDYPVISSSLATHNLAKDFNFKFFRIANTYRNRENIISCSLPCKITITYSPIVKIGI